MKRFTCALLVSIILSLTGCGAKQALPTVEDSRTAYTSETSVEDCYLCGGNIEGSAILPWGQNNVALISLNTFEIKPIEINRYDRLTGQLIENATGTVSFGGSGQQDNGFTMSMLVDSDRGYATGSLRFYDDEALDVEKAAAYLCSDCLNRILPYDLNRCFGVGAINLATKELRVFEECVSGFGLGGFYFDCHVMGERKHNSYWLDLLIFYCPIRYGSEC